MDMVYLLYLFKTDLELTKTDLCLLYIGDKDKGKINKGRSILFIKTQRDVQKCIYD